MWSSVSGGAPLESIWDELGNFQNFPGLQISSHFLSGGEGVVVKQASKQAKQESKQAKQASKQASKASKQASKQSKQASKQS